MQKFTNNSRLFHDSLQEKRRYRMYKKGKFWMTAGMSVMYAGLILASKTETVSASTGDESNVKAETDSAAKNTVVLQSSKTDAAQTTATDTKAEDNDTKTAATTKATDTQSAATTDATADDTKAADTQTEAAKAEDTKAAANDSADTKDEDTKSAATDATSDAKTQADKQTLTSSEAVSGVVATVQGKTATVGADLTALTFDVTLADGYTAPTWTAADFDFSQVDTSKAGTYTVTLSKQGIKDLHAANDTKMVTLANVKGATLTLTAATAADKTATDEVKQSAATDTANKADVTTDTESDTDTAASTVEAPTFYSDAAADELNQAATKALEQMNTYAETAQAQADASSTDTIVTDDAISALKEHVTTEQGDVAEFINQAKTTALTDSNSALNLLVNAASVINTMNQELAQAAVMIQEDKNGVKKSAVIAAQMAFEKLSLPDGVSAKLSAYGDLVVTASSQETFTQVISELQSQGLYTSFRNVVDPDAASSNVAEASNIFERVGKFDVQLYSDSTKAIAKSDGTFTASSSNGFNVVTQAGDKIVKAYLVVQNEAVQVNSSLVLTTPKGNKVAALKNSWALGPTYKYGWDGPDNQGGGCICGCNKHSNGSW